MRYIIIFGSYYEFYTFKILYSKVNIGEHTSVLMYTNKRNLGLGILACLPPYYISEIKVVRLYESSQQRKSGSPPLQGYRNSAKYRTLPSPVVHILTIIVVCIILFKARLTLFFFRALFRRPRTLAQSDLSSF